VQYVLPKVTIKSSHKKVARLIHLADSTNMTNMKTLTKISGIILIVLMTNLFYSKASFGIPTQTASEVTVEINPQTALGSVNENLIGVNQMPSNQKAVNLVKNLGVKWARVDASLENISNGVPSYNCKTGLWNPSVLSQRLNDVKSAGANVELIIDYTPACLAYPPTNSEQDPYAQPDIGPDQAKWDSLITQVGTWAINHGVRYFEVWNEPDWVFWQGGLTGYLLLYKNTALSLEKAAQNTGTKIYIGGPALANVGGQMDMGWLSSFLKYVSQNNLPLSFISYHVYADDPFSGPNQIFPNGFCLGLKGGPNNIPCYYTPFFSTNPYKDEATQAKQELLKYLDLHPFLWIDEWNINGEYDARDNSSFAAAFLLSALIKAESAGVERMCWYNVYNGPNSGYNAFGLLTDNISPKPSYNAFLFWHDMTGSQLDATTKVISLNSANDLEVVASKDRSGKISILVDNFVPYDPTGNFGFKSPAPYPISINIRVPNLSNAENYGIKEALILPGTSGHLFTGNPKFTASAHTIDLSPITLQEDSVALIQLTPKTSANNVSLIAIIIIIVLAVFGLIVLLLFFKPTRQ
jgi:hypothetical protein